MGRSNILSMPNQGDEIFTFAGFFIAGFMETKLGTFVKWHIRLF